MSTSALAVVKPNYGIDAPGVIRNLSVVAIVGLAIWAIPALGIGPEQLAFPILGVHVAIPLQATGFAMGTPCAIMAAWMLWDSKVGKIRRRERLLNMLKWTGHEQVLDVGCGRGLMLVGAARRLTTGKATGIDLWKAEDLSGNYAEAALENARREGVADRVEVKTGDMRQMPFEPEAFDVVVSRAAIHNLCEVADRVRAFSEIVRVLKPGGRLLLEDIRHRHEYATTLTARGFGEIRRVDNKLSSWLARLLSRGSLDPVTLIVRKPDKLPLDPA
jgi:ubiquinone/menaquinone biosynthesis C-methylase UbiE